ncbi:uncharacterized protein [Palaemon carinicauda]|uniref:uncharacterized protein n=1 Tax=Palaemon carinicauda TaxID=392227 RepID=UPI0035B642B6
MEFVKYYSTLQMNVRNTGKILLREKLQINFRRNEMMIFAFKIGESGAWVVEVRKGDFMRAVQLTDVSLDEVDDIEVYNEQSSVNRKVRFCNAVTASSPAGTSSQTTDHRAEPTSETATCPVLPTGPVAATCPKCPKCDACHSDISSLLSESAQIGVDKNSRTVQEAELVTDEATVLYSNGEKGCMESNTKILLCILMAALALSTLAMVISTALACKYKRKLLLSKTRTKQAESVRWNPNQPPSVLGEETQSLESPQDNRDSIYYHVYEDPYKYAGQPNNHQQCNDSPSAIKGSPRNGSETESIPCSFRCVSPPDDTIYDHLQF